MYYKEVNSWEIFSKSRYFNAFIEFSKFIHKAKLADVDFFIALMKNNDIYPTLWTKDETYQLYIDELDKKSSPMYHLKITLKTINSLVETYNIDVSEIFTLVNVNEILHLIRERKLSPWVLLLCRSFKIFVIERLNSEQKNILSRIINKKIWEKRLDKHPTELKIIKKCIKELNI